MKIRWGKKKAKELQAIADNRDMKAFTQHLTQNLWPKARRTDPTLQSQWIENPKSKERNPGKAFRPL